MNILVKTAVTIGAMAVAVKAIDNRLINRDTSKRLAFNQDGYLDAKFNSLQSQINKLDEDTSQAISVLNTKTNVSLTDSGLLND